MNVMAQTPPLRASSPPWPVIAPDRISGAVPPLRRVLWSRGAVSWYIGSVLALLWLIGTGQEVLSAAASPMSAAVGLTLVVGFGLAFLIAVPLGWAAPARWRFALVVALFGLSFSLFPWLEWGVRGLWTYVGVALGMMVLPWALTVGGILLLGILAVFYGYLLDGWGEDDLWLPAILLSVSLMMAAFARTLATMNRLRATQEQLAELAVERERDRVARDIHDILGHSLTVVTVKAQLASRLVADDPEGARREIDGIEELARGALSDVRSTVAGVRGVSVSGELAAARAALEAAGIEALLPSSTESVPADRRELAGWIVREGVTNVVRHSGATRCRVTLGATVIEVADDGSGPADAGVTGSGLAGLRDRIAAAGGTMSVGRSDLGGFLLRAQL